MRSAAVIAETIPAKAFELVSKGAIAISAKRGFMVESYLSVPVRVSMLHPRLSWQNT